MLSHYLGLARISLRCLSLRTALGLLSGNRIIFEDELIYDVSRGIIDGMNLLVLKGTYEDVDSIHVQEDDVID